MEMRKLKYPGVIVLVAVLTMILGAGIAIGAAEPQTPAEICTLVDSSGQLQTGKTLELVMGPMEDLVSAPNADGAKQYIWKYSLTNVSPINQVSALVPACFNSQGSLIAGYYQPSIGSGGSGAQILDPGEGDPTTNFGVWDKLDYAYRMAYTGSDAYLGQEALTNKRVMSVQIKSGKNIYYCQNIAGPSCPKPFQQYAAPTYRELLTDPGTGEPIKVCLMIDPTTGCETPVDCVTKDLLPSIPLSDLQLTIPGTPTVGAPIIEAATPGTACATFLLRTPGNDSLWSISGGYATKVWP